MPIERRLCDSVADLGFSNFDPNRLVPIVTVVLLATAGRVLRRLGLGKPTVLEPKPPVEH
jgi:hypothetical protein